MKNLLATGLLFAASTAFAADWQQSPGGSSWYARDADYVYVTIPAPTAVLGSEILTIAQFNGKDALSGTCAQYVNNGAMGGSYVLTLKTWRFKIPNFIASSIAPGALSNDPIKAQASGLIACTVGDKTDVAATTLYLPTGSATVNLTYPGTDLVAAIKADGDARLKAEITKK